MNRLMAISVQQSDQERFAYVRRATGLTYAELIRRFIRAYSATGAHPGLPNIKTYVPPTQDPVLRPRRSGPGEENTGD